MNTHLIIILDCSGSMSEPFQPVTNEHIKEADNISPETSKIEGAKNELLKIIYRDKSRDYRITIISFNNSVIEPVCTWSSKKDEIQIREYLNNLHAGGRTALHLALKRALELEDSDSDGVSKYYIITDGISNNPNLDIEIINKASSSQRSKFRGILIDKNPRGESHLSNICDGDYTITIGQAEFNQVMALEGIRFDLEDKINILQANMKDIRKNTEKLSITLPLLQETVDKLEDKTKHQASQLMDLMNTIKSQRKIEVDYYNQQEYSTIEFIDLQLEVIRSIEQLILDEKKFLKMSYAIPKLVSKRHSSSLLIQIYPSERFDQTIKDLSDRLRSINKKMEDYQTSSYDSPIELGMTVIVSVECAGIQISKPVTLFIEDKVNTASFVVKPEDTCEVGSQIGIISISNKNSGVEIISVNCIFHVVDFVIDHISRPFVLKLAAALSGLGAMIMFILTFFGEVDTTFGLASGTTIGAVAVALYLQFKTLFQRLNKISETP